MKIDDKDGVALLFPSPVPPMAPPTEEPRGGPSTDLHRRTLDDAQSLAPMPGADEAQRAAQRRAALLDLSQMQDDALPGLLVKRTVQGAAAGGVLYALYRIIKAYLGRRQ